MRSAQAGTDRHREVERRLPGSRLRVRAEDREPDEFPHSTFGVRVVRRRLRNASFVFFVGLPVLRDVLRDVDCEREWYAVPCESVTMSIRRPLGGMMTYCSPCRGGGRTIWPDVYSTWRGR